MGGAARGERVEIATELFRLTGERFGSDPGAWRAWRTTQRGAPAEAPSASKRTPAAVDDPPAVDLSQVRAAVARLTALGLPVEVTPERLAATLRADHWMDRTRTLEAQLLRAGDVGWAFALEGPEDSVPGGNFLGGDPKFLSKLLAKMAALSGGAFAPSGVVDESRPARVAQYEGDRDQVLQFDFAGRSHTVVIDADALQGQGCARTLGRVFDAVNAALAAAGAPLRYVCVPDAARVSPHADAYYRVLAVRADALAALRGFTPVVYGGAAVPGSAQAWQSARLRRAGELVPAGRLRVFDLECIDGPPDYVQLAHALAALTGGALSIESASCERADERGAFRLAFRAGGRDYRAELPARGDFVALPELLGVLNLALAAGGGARSLREVRDEALGQESAVAFVDATEAAALREHGLLAPDEHA